MLSSTAYNLMEACRESGCPVCRLEQRGVERYLDNQFYENVNSPEWRDQLRRSLGFCHEHAWLGVKKRLGDALGFSIIYHDILSSILNGWPSTSGSIPVRRGRASWLEKLIASITPRRRCPVCSYRDELTRGLLSSLAKELHTSELKEALESSDGLCLNHVKRAIEVTKDASMMESLLTVHRAKLETLKTELAEFIRKSDYRIIQEGFGHERDAWQRAIRLLVGPSKEE